MTKTNKELKVDNTVFIRDKEGKTAFDYTEEDNMIKDSREFKKSLEVEEGKIMEKQTANTNPAPTLTYIFASEIINGNWSIDNLPALLKDDIIALVVRLTGKTEEELRGQ